MVERAKRKDLNADTMLCEIYGAAESVCGALRQILKDFNVGVLRVLIRLPFLAKRQASLEFEVYHMSTYSMIFVFSLFCMALSHRSGSRSAWQRLRQSSVFPFMKSA